MKPKKPKINCRDKGIRGERLVIDWLQPIVDATVAKLGASPVLLQRNTLQSDVGGIDIVGLRWLAPEVKNCAKDTPAMVEGWWQQACDQAEDGQTPVLFYKVGRRPFRVRMEGGWGEGMVWNCGPVEINPTQFEAWFTAMLEAELQKVGQKGQA